MKQQNDNQVLHVNTGPVVLKCGQAISTCVIVFMCSPVYIIMVVKGNETNVHPTQGKYGHKRQKGEPAASPLNTNKARMHTSIISFLFSKLFSLSYLVTLTNVSALKRKCSKRSLNVCACDDFKS